MSKAGDTSNSIQQPLRGILVFNEKLARTNTLVNDLLAVQKDGRVLFYHLRFHIVDDTSQASLQLHAANFHRRKVKMGGGVVSKHNEMQNELILFLKNKRVM